MNIKNEILITLALSLALSTSINFCSEELAPIYRSTSEREARRMQPVVTEAAIKQQEQPDTSYFQWRSRLTALKKRVGESIYPRAAKKALSEGSGQGVVLGGFTTALMAVATTIDSTVRYYNRYDVLPSAKEMSRVFSEVADYLVMPTVIGSAIALTAVHLLGMYNIKTEKALLEAAKEQFSQLMPLITGNMNKLMNETNKIKTLEQYEASPYKDLFKQIGDLKFE